MPEPKPYSLSKAIGEMLDRGNLTGLERSLHYEFSRELESMTQIKWMDTANARDQALFVPLDLFTGQTRQLSVTGGFPIGLETAGISNLRTWSACLRAGANILSGLSRNVNLWSIGALPVPEWLPELGMITPSDPLFVNYPVKPFRISGMINISTQLLRQQSGPELDRILVSDISRQLASYLDAVALYGGGPAANQPTGLLNVAGVNLAVAIDSADLHGSFCSLEALIEAANVDMTNYSVLVSPTTRKTLRSTPSFPGGSITTWAELTNPQSSPEITDGQCFAGCWNNLTFCLWGRAIEVLVDPFTLSQNNQTRLMSSLLCDVGVRYPAAFGVTAAVT